jgi:photosystem II stability/assembly factor-like uncharacterized protein
MKRKIILLSAVLLSMFAVSQEIEKEKKETFSNIYQLMKRKDLNLKTIEKLANDYFKVKGTGKGSGYKHFQRWLFEAKFHVDKNWNFISPQKETAEYQKFVQNNSLSLNKSQAAPVGIWTEVGPFSVNRTESWAPGFGRVSAMAVHPSNQNTIYVGSPSGGIWKSTNGGSAWLPLTDFNPLWMSIFSLAIDPNNQSVLYAGTGNNANQVIKSIDGGSTWTVLGSGPEGEIRKILIHPTNSNIVFAVATNGIFRSSNGGLNWVQTPISFMEDIEFKPNDPNIMLASGIFVVRSTDNGITWSEFNDVVGIERFDRTLIAVSPNNPNYVYAVQANGNIFGALFLSTDAGLTFTLKVLGDTVGHNFFGYRPDGFDSTGQAQYDMALCVSPVNANEVHIGGINTWKSIDGGSSFVPTSHWDLSENLPLGYNHADIHGLEFVGNTLYVYSDGGLYKSLNNGTSFTPISAGLGIKQLYNLATSNTATSVLVAGAQDNGTIARNTSGVFQDWIGADGFECLVSPTNPSNIWGSIQNGQIYRSTDGGKTLIDLGSFGGSFNTSIAGHPSNSNIIYGAGEGVFKSTDGGLNFNKISGTFITSTLEDIAVSQSNPNYIYACELTNLYVSTDAGSTWASFEQPGVISDFVISPTDPTKLWYTTTFGEVYLATNSGATIENLTGNLPALGAQTIAVDYNSTDENLYVGMTIGVYTYSNKDQSWTNITANLPQVAISELDIQKGTGLLRVATYGRGIWMYNLPTAACAVAYEPNDVLADAKSIFKNTDVFGAISTNGDEDYYSFSLKSTDIIRISLENLPADFDLELYNSAGFLKGSYNGGSASELIIRPLTAGNYKVRVFGYNGANGPNCYKLIVKSISLLSKGANINTYDVEADADKVSDAGVILYPNPANDQLNIDLSSLPDAYSVLIMNKEGSVQLRRDNVGDKKLLNFNVSSLTSGIYFVQIFSITKELKTLKLIKE